MSSYNCSKEEKTGIIMTVKGSVPVEKAGIWLTHEHILVDFIGADSINESRYDKEAVIRKVLPFLKQIKAFGCMTFVECTPSYLGKDPIILKALSDSTGMNIITNTGYYGANNNKYIPGFALVESADQIAEQWIREWENGINGTGIKPGFIKIAVNNGSLSDFHKKLIIAAARTHLKTGLTIASHTGPAVPAFEQLDLLTREGVSPEAFIWVHAMNEKNPDNLIKAARMGAWISLDKLNDKNVEEHFKIIKVFKDNNLLNKVLISHDAGWFDPAKKNGGDFRGYTTLFKILIPALKKDNFSEKEIKQLIVINPSKAFEIRIRKQKQLIPSGSQTFGYDYKADIIVYGGTSAAITAAVQSAQMGRSVVLVSPDKHLGGMSSSGLGFTDTGNKEVIGGLARKFYQLIYDHYNSAASWNWQKKSDYGNKGQGNPAIDGEKRTMWIFEPHAAEEAFEKMISGAKIQVFRDEWLDRGTGLVKENGSIISIKTLSGKTFTGKIFIDATYEGDLMAASGVKYVTGREANTIYNENWNGVQAGVFQHGHYFKDKLDPYKVPKNPASGLLPCISSESVKKNGTGDEKIQAYCYRLCLTQNPGNKVPITRPERYDATQYELLARLSATRWNEFFGKYDPIPNLKTDVNNHGPVSFDNIGMNWDYPEASYERRREILKEHESYQKGLLYFMATDLRIPENVRETMNKWGYAKDEFTDNGNWPYNIYVRESRRMIGEYIMTEKDVLGKRDVPRPVGMGSYAMDSHNVQRYVTPEGYVQNEGDIGVKPDRPYQIDLGAILPDKEECKNLLVPVCVSSSHIAFGSIRMEPVFMILGQSAGTLGSLAVEKHKSIYDISYNDLRSKLLENGQILKFDK
jgi:predicted metal-dependent phosphotriesterase family hydrolase